MSMNGHHYFKFVYQRSFLNEIRFLVEWRWIWRRFLLVDLSGWKTTEHIRLSLSFELLVSIRIDFLWKFTRLGWMAMNKNFFIWFMYFSDLLTDVVDFSEHHMQITAFWFVDIGPLNMSLIVLIWLGKLMSDKDCLWLLCKNSFFSDLVHHFF